MADMTSIARPYAKAAFEFAVAHEQITLWSDLLNTLTQIIADPGCKAFISNPMSTPEQHGECILAVLKTVKSLSGLTHAKQFVELLAHNHRLLALPSIETLYQELRSTYEKTMTVEVISFAELSNEQQARLTDKLSKRLLRQVTLSVSIDPTILGGAIIRAGHLVFDGSVRTQIKNLSTNLAA